MEDKRIRADSIGDPLYELMLPNLMPSDLPVVQFNRTPHSIISNTSAAIMPASLPALAPTQPVDYLFGYGSIISSASRHSTLKCTAEEDEAVFARISSKFGYIRSWSYRCSTGFTALGLSKLDKSGSGCKRLKKGICGVLFPVMSSEALAAFDLRETGYFRVAVPYELIEIDAELGSDKTKETAKSLQASLSSRKIWIYIPEPGWTASPDEDFPILQTYVDICVRGCLEWGGPELAKEFLRATHGWNEFYLNDAPMSRRPWLHRPNYSIIDKCLEDMSDHVRMVERRHPEEFASRHLTTLNGMWNVPQRNSTFVGREEQLAALHEKLFLGTQSSRGGGNGGNNNGSISLAQLVGIGGVGKTQVAIEYCHRHFGSCYGLVAFIRAESPALIAAELRRFALDMGLLRENVLGRRSMEGSYAGTPEVEVTSSSSADDFDDASIDDETVVEIIKRKLARCRYRWLIVFDNVEDPSIINSYLPRGRMLGNLSQGIGASSTSTDNAQTTRGSSESEPVQATPKSAFGSGSRSDRSLQRVTGSDKSSQRVTSSHSADDPFATLQSASRDTFESPQYTDPAFPSSPNPNDDEGLLGMGCGHVLVTTRVSAGSVGGGDAGGHRLLGYFSSPILLECFDRTESLRFLDVSMRQFEGENGTSTTTTTMNETATAAAEIPRRDHHTRHLMTTGENSASTFSSCGVSSPCGVSVCTEETRVLATLADRMGHLPLALAQASAYIARCDVTVTEYLRRLDKLIITEDAGDYSIVSSLSVTLDRIQPESPAAFDVLQHIGFLSPDGITKQLVALILEAAYWKTRGPQTSLGRRESASFPTSSMPVTVHALAKFNEDQHTMQHQPQTPRPPATGVAVMHLHHNTIGREKDTESESKEEEESSSGTHTSSFVGNHLATAAAAVATTAIIASILTLVVFQRPVTNLRAKIGVISLSLVANCAAGALPSLFIEARAKSNQRQQQQQKQKQQPERHGLLTTDIAVAGSTEQGGISPLQQQHHNATCLHHHPDHSTITAASTVDVGPSNFTPELLSLSRLSPRLSGEDLTEDQIMFETDKVWELLKQFSLLSVRGSRNSRIGSIHRLQQAVLRSRVVRSLGPSGVPLVLERCVWAVGATWKFDPSDARTWEDCGNNLNHIQVLNEYIAGYRDLQSDNIRRFAVLLTEAAAYSTVALSRFDVSQNLAESASTMQARILSSLPPAEIIALDSGFQVVRDSLLREHSDTLHILGKITRIRGDYDRSLQSLEAALDMRSKIGSFKVADTLHELGVLSLRRHDYKVALKYLSDSLKLKQDLTVEAGGELGLETTEAATLHQLAVIATAKLRYDEAESLLERALLLEGGDGEASIGGSKGSIVSRAATLQQLGRVALRRGLLNEAETRLSQALKLYSRVYGEQKASRHINVAAVRHQLGCCLSVMHRYAEASEQFSIALAARELIHGDSLEESDHGASDNHNHHGSSGGSEEFDPQGTDSAGAGRMEILVEIQFLGQAELERGHVDTAEAHFRRQKAMCERMLQTILHSGEGGGGGGHCHGQGYGHGHAPVEGDTAAGARELTRPLFNRGSSFGGHIEGYSRDAACSNDNNSSSSIGNVCSSMTSQLHRKLQSLKKSLLFAIYSLRKIARRRRDTDRAKELSKEAQQVDKRYPLPGASSGSDSRCAPAQFSNEVMLPMSVGRVKVAYAAPAPVAASSTAGSGTSVSGRNQQQISISSSVMSDGNFNTRISISEKIPEGRAAVLEQRLMASILEARDRVRLTARKLRAKKKTCCTVSVSIPVVSPFTTTTANSTATANASSAYAAEVVDKQMTLLADLKNVLNKKMSELEVCLAEITAASTNTNTISNSNTSSSSKNGSKNDSINSRGGNGNVSGKFDHFTSAAAGYDEKSTARFSERLTAIEKVGERFIWLTKTLVDTKGSLVRAALIDAQTAEESSVDLGLNLDNNNDNNGGTNSYTTVSVAADRSDVDDVLLDWQNETAKELFGKCDFIRTELRSLGVKVEDS